jgi:phosphonate transport system ATP-binding protein
MIKFENICKKFGNVEVLKGINLEIKEGEFVILLGLSGAGKSTLLRTINGLVTVCDGQVTVDGIKVSKDTVRQIRKKVGMIFQQFNLVKRSSVLRNVLCGRLGHSNVLNTCISIFDKDDLENARACLKRVNILEKIHERADKLSGGQQQRVGIARAITQKPKILLADEPVASLDPKTSKEIMGLLKKINKEDKITVIVSLHDLHLAYEFGERFVGLNHGRIVVDKPVTELNEEDIKKIYEGCEVASLSPMDFFQVDAGKAEYKYA